MKYPILNNCLEFTRKNENEYIVYNGFTGKRRKVSKEFVEFLRRFDGKTLPARIFAKVGTKNKKEIDRWLEHLVDEDWLRDSYYRVETFPFYMISAWIPKKNNSLQQYAKSLDLLLRIFWIPVFFIGLLFWKYRVFPYEKSALMSVLGILLGGVIGAILHELGHVISAYANKKSVYEVGVGLVGIIPYMYTLIDTKTLSTRKELRVISAGVKINLLYSGILFLLAGVQTVLSPMFEIAAMVNIVFAIINTMLAYGLDGMKTIQYIMLNKNVNVLETFFALINNGDKKREFLAENGVTGQVALVNLLVIVSFQVFYPALYLLLFLGVF